MAESPQTTGCEEVQLGNVEIERIDPLLDQSWDAKVAVRDDHSIFHRAAWARVLIESYGHRPYYLRVLAAGAEVALVPLMEVQSSITGCRGVSLPFSDYAGPLWSDPAQASEVYQALIDFAVGRKWKRLEIRDDRVPPDSAPPYCIYETHELDLTPDINVIERNLDSAVRRAIRKARRSGLDIRVETDAGAVVEFYALHCRTRRRNGLPPQPFRFFQAIGRNVIEPGLGFVVLARSGRHPVAGAIFLHSGGRAIYKFGASDIAHWHLRPNQAVMWQAIRSLIDCGCVQLNFGRTAKNDEGLRRFKLSWGCSSRPLHYFRHHSGGWVSAVSEPKESYPLIFSRLPVALNRLAGKLIYPHLD